MFCSACTGGDSGGDVTKEVDGIVQPRAAVRPRFFDSVRITSAFVRARAGSLVVNSGAKEFSIVLPGECILSGGKSFAELRRGDQLSIDVRYNDPRGTVAMGVEYLGPGRLPKPTGRSASCSHKEGDRCR